MEGRGEIRRLHIIYFLSRTGRVEQPHLVRVHHLHRNGVHLRDVKRWLSDLRGKDMPDAFAWSYKRRYKDAYVWQDLLDDDLITPISDNEFVLKGSQIVTSDNHPKIQRPISETEASAVGESFGSSVTYEKEKDLVKQSSDKEEGDRKLEKCCSFSKESDNNDDDDDDDDDDGDGVGDNVSKPAVKRKSVSNGSLFRNLLSCRAADTHDSVVVVRRKNNSSDNDKNIGKYEKLGGSSRIHWNETQQQQQHARRSYDGGVNSTTKEKEKIGHKQYKPVHGPTCSQCGKTFKPEKMHKHMKACKGMARNGKRQSTKDDTACNPLLTN